jgi:hypothetical protein
MTSSGTLWRVVLGGIEVSEEITQSIIRDIRIGKPGISIAVTSNRNRLSRNTTYLITLTMEAEHLFIQEPHGVTF